MSWGALSDFLCNCSWVARTHRRSQLQAGWWVRRELPGLPDGDQHPQPAQEDEELQRGRVPKGPSGTWQVIWQLRLTSDVMTTVMLNRSKTPAYYDSGTLGQARHPIVHPSVMKRTVQCNSYVYLNQSVFKRLPLPWRIFFLLSACYISRV